MASVPAAASSISTTSPSDEADAAAGGGFGGGGRRTAKQQQQVGPTLSKRQRLKQRNTKNLIPQHPKIQQAPRRATAYLRTAGLLNPVVPDVDLQAPELKFGRLLGGADQRVRHRAVMQLQSYLQARSNLDANATTTDTGGISELDLLKLWKGLWHTLYLADKAVVQDELAKHISKLLWCVAGTEEEDEYAGQCYLDMFPDDDDDKGDVDDEEEDGEGDEEVDVIMEEIANTLNQEYEHDEESKEEEGGSVESFGEDAAIEEEEERWSAEDDEDDDHGSLDDMLVRHCRGAHLASLFVRTFFRTLRREWGNMDKYRVDKFYTLMRYIMHEVLQYLAQRHWNLGIIRLFNDAVFEEALRHTPNGLRYHLIDVVLEELSAVNAKAPILLTEATFLDVLEPYFALAQTGSGDDTIHQRVVDNVLLKFLERFSVVRTDATLDKLLVVLDQVHVGTVAQFIFDIASDGETRDKYRKNLYVVHKAYARRLKRAKDVDLHQGEATEEDVAICGCGEEHEHVAADHELVSAVEAVNGSDDEAGLPSAIVEKEPKKRKKHKKAKSSELPPAIVEKEAKKKKKHKKDKLPEAEGSKSHRKRKSKTDAEQDEVQTESPSNEVHMNPEQKCDEATKSKKRSKKAKKNHAQLVTEEELLVPAQAHRPQEKLVVKKLDENFPRARKEKGRGKVDDSTSDIARIVTEEELLISAQAQRAAKLALKKKREEETAARSKKDGKVDDDGKRVKFGVVNRSRSWKASMKGLRDMDSPIRANVTPEKGILLNKGAKIKKKSEKTQGKRRRAVDYF